MGRILVVEDSPAIRLLFRRRLEMKGHEVEEAANGLEALNRLERSTPDLIILDETMPLFDGASFLSRVRAEMPDLPVVVVSARSEDESSPIMAEAQARLGKPIDFDLLLSTIERLLRPEA